MNSFFYTFRRIVPILLFMLAGRGAHAQYAHRDTLHFVPSDRVHIAGHLGQQIDLSIQNRILKQDIDELVEPFRHRNETQLWHMEFWGKWMLSAAEAYRYQPTPALRAKIEDAATKLLATQSADGYIGNYATQAHLHQWDIWGRKYVLLGLVNYYDVTNNKEALKAAQRVADHLLRELEAGKINIVETGMYRGLPSSSILVPMIKLWQRTGNNAYKEFCLSIVRQWETSSGPQLISKAEQGVDVAERAAFPTSWWSWENGGKAYEMMSCYEGLIELFKATGEKRFLQAVEMAAKNIMTTEINVAGSGSAFECWYHGAARQTEATYHTMETCVTTTWMKLCTSLLEITGDAMYADALERSAYNALAAAMLPDGSLFAKYSPLIGTRSLGEKQCGMNINCCIANGPRGWLLLPSTALMSTHNSIYINLYTAMRATVPIEKKNIVNIVQDTSYPVSDSVVVAVDPATPAAFTLLLRISAWSAYHSISVNNKSYTVPIKNGFAAVSRPWKKGDRVVLRLDLRGKLTTHEGYASVARGPVLLARDTRFQDGFVDEACVLKSTDGIVPLELDNTLPGVWMSFATSAVLGTNLELHGDAKVIHLCDFSSAGNSWNENNRYRVWLPKPLDVMEKRYVPLR